MTNLTQPAAHDPHDWEYADWRKHVAYGGPFTYAQYRELRAFWRSLGGQWNGPTVEHGGMSEQKLLPLLNHFRDLAFR